MTHFSAIFSVFIKWETGIPSALAQRVSAPALACLGCPLLNSCVSWGPKTGFSITDAIQQVSSQPVLLQDCLCPSVEQCICPCWNSQCFCWASPAAWLGPSAAMPLTMWMGPHGDTCKAGFDASFRLYLGPSSARCSGQLHTAVLLLCMEEASFSSSSLTIFPGQTCYFALFLKDF